MTSQNRVSVVLLALLAVALIFAGPLRAGQDPVATVDGLHEVLEALGPSSTMNDLLPVLEKTYDLPKMALRAAGPGAAAAPETERAALTNAFGRFTAATYLDRFKGASGLTFATSGVREAPRGRQIVDAQVLPAGGDPVALGYLMEDRGGGDWRIVDVYLDGSISELARRRSEFGGIVKSQGVSGLVTALDQLTDRLQ